MLCVSEEGLAIAMEGGYKACGKAKVLVVGRAGCHSKFVKLVESVAQEMVVHLYKLDSEVSKIDRKAPTRELIEQVADRMKEA